MSVYDQYITVRKQIEYLEQQKRKLETRIIEEIKNLSEPMRKGDNVFSVVRRVSYNFSDKVKELKEATKFDIKQASDEISKPLIELQKKEIQNGTATQEEILNLRMTWTPQK